MEQATQLTRADIIKKANQLAASLLSVANIEEICVEDDDLSDKDAERVRKQIDKIAERLRRA